MNANTSQQRDFSTSAFKIGKWLIDPNLNVISFNGHTAQLEPQPMEVLIYLVNKNGKLATQDELLGKIWPDVVVSENVLSRCISILRKALDDDARNPKYIETISKSGYRLMVPAIMPDAPVQTTISKTTLYALLLLVFFSVILVFTTFISNSGEESNSIMFTPIPGSLEKGTEWDPAVSPDGKYLAFSWKGIEQDNYDIYLKVIGTESISKLTNGNGWHFDPVWMHGGTHLAYYNRSEDNCGIYMKPILGGVETKILGCHEGMSEDFDITADGSHLVYNGMEDRKTSKSLFLYSSEENKTFRITTSPDTYLGDYQPKFSPDGRRVVFKRARNKVIQDLYLYDFDNKKEIRITDKNSTIFGADWLNENEIVFASMNTGQYMLWKKELITGSITLMPINDHHIINPNYSIQSGVLSYMKITDDINIWRQPLKPDTSSAKLLLGTSATEKHPSISPDGKYIAFVSNRSGKYEIWRSDIDGSNLLQLTASGHNFVGNPNWSNDGQRIVFEMYNDQSDIYTIGVNGDALTQVTKSPYDDEIGSFGNADDWIYFSSNRSGRWEIWKSGRSQTLQQVTFNGGYAPVLPTSMDSLIYVKRDSLGIWAMSTSTSESERKMGEGFNPLYWGNLAISERYGYIMDPTYMGIVEINLQTDQSKLYPKLQGNSPRMSRVVSLDKVGQNIILSKIDVTDTDLMIVEDMNTIF